MNRLKSIGKTEHERIIEMLSAYIDGELDAAHKARVEAHLRECQDCARDLHTLRQTVNLLGQLPVVKTPRSFLIREAQVAPRRRADVHWSWAYPALQGATVLAFLLFVVVFAGDMALTYFAPTMKSAPMLAYYGAPAEEMTGLPPMALEMTDQATETVVVEKVAAATPTAMPLPPGPTGTPAPAGNEGTWDAGLPTAEAMAVMVEQTPAATPTRASEEATLALTEEPMMAIAERSAAATPPPPAEIPPPTTTPGAVAEAPAEAREGSSEGMRWAGGPSLVNPARVALWVLEVGLLILAVALLTATLWMRRRRWHK